MDARGCRGERGGHRDDEGAQLTEPAGAAVETYDLTRRFGDRVAVDALTLSVPAGTVFGFLGPNGAGKTTTVRMLAALIAPSAGSAVVAGYRLGDQNDRLRRSVGILTETPGLYERLDAVQNLTYFGRLYDLSRPVARERAERYLKALGLWERRAEPVATFSKGMRQRLAIARALLHEPAVLFLDEPTAGLDPEAAHQVRGFIRSLRAEGRTIFLTTHNLTEADELCDAIAVFRGRLLRVGSPTELRLALFGRGTVVTTGDDPARWAETARGLPFARAVEITADAISVRLDHPEAENPLLVRALVEAGAPIRAVTPISASLEDVYLQLVREGG